jgi:phage shock protein A
MQVKTQVAIAITDQHLLLNKQRENEASAVEWIRKAEIAVAKKQDDLARPAIERALSYRQMSESFSQQLDDQQQQVEALKSALRKLEQKLAEAQAKSELLISQHRRARALTKASEARMAVGDRSQAATFDRMKQKVMHSEAVGLAKAEMAGDDMHEKLMSLGREDEIERLLLEIKQRKGLSG